MLDQYIIRMNGGFLIDMRQDFAVVDKNGGQVFSKGVAQYLVDRLRVMGVGAVAAAVPPSAKIGARRIQPDSWRNPGWEARRDDKREFCSCGEPSDGHAFCSACDPF